MRVRTKTAALAAVVLAAMLAGVVLLTTGNGSDEAPGAGSASTTAPAGGVSRARLGEAAPANAPGQSLYLEQVTIAPGARLAEHFHQGTQVARVVSGVLTYNIVSGTASITRSDGRTEEASGPKEVRLGAGETVLETRGLVHFGANDTGQPVVIELAALLERGAPLATTVGAGATGTPIRLSAQFESQTRSLFTAGPAGSVVYGWNRLGGTATLDGGPVGVDMLAGVSYSMNSGPFSGFVTFTFPDGSTLGVAMNGATQGSAVTSDAAFAATLGVVGGTGRFEAAKGTGTFVGARSPSAGPCRPRSSSRSRAPGDDPASGRGQVRAPARRSLAMARRRERNRRRRPQRRDRAAVTGARRCSPWCSPR